MKLFFPSNAKAFIYAVVPKGAKEGTPPTFQPIAAPSLEHCEGEIERRNMRNAYPYVMGRYDEEGFYCTYTPPIEGIKPGKFVRHPLAYQAKVEFDKELLTKRYGAEVAA